MIAHCPYVHKNATMEESALLRTPVSVSNGRTRSLMDESQEANRCFRTRMETRSYRDGRATIARRQFASKPLASFLMWLLDQRQALLPWEVTEQTPYSHVQIRPPDLLFLVALNSTPVPTPVWITSLSPATMVNHSKLVVASIRMTLAAVY